MRRNFWLALLGLVVAVGFAIVAMPRTAELANPSDNRVSTTNTTRPSSTSSSTTTASTTTSTTRGLESFTPEELEAFNAFVAPTTTTTTPPPPPTTTTTVYVAPPATTYVEPEPQYEPEPEPEYEPAYTGGGCVIPAYICQRESGMSYTALNPSSGAGGMYQFMPSTWNAIARAIAPEWIGTPPHTAPPYVQDQFAIYLWDGGRGCSHWSAC